MPRNRADRQSPGENPDAQIPPQSDLAKISQGLEGETGEPVGPNFARDAEEFVALENKQDDLHKQQKKMSKGSKVLGRKPDADAGAIDKEKDALAERAGAIAARYGKSKDDSAFRVDAFRHGELKEEVAELEVTMRSLEGRLRTAKNSSEKADLERELNDTTREWQAARKEMSAVTNRYAEKEKKAKADLASASDADVDAVVENGIRAALEPDETAVNLAMLTAIENDRAAEEEDRKHRPTKPTSLPKRAKPEEPTELTDDDIIASISAPKETPRARAMRERVEKNRARFDAAKAYDDVLRAAKEDAPIVEARLATAEVESAVEAAIAERPEQFKKLIARARTIDQLKAAVEEFGAVESSNKEKMSAKEINQWIDSAVQYPDGVPLRMIPTAFGLQKKVKELLIIRRFEQEDRAAGRSESDPQRTAVEEVDGALEFDPLEQKFFARSKAIDRVHGRGVLPKDQSETEKEGERNNDAIIERDEEAAKQEKRRNELQKNLAKLLSEMDGFDQQLKRAEQVLQELGIDPHKGEVKRSGTDKLFGWAFNRLLSEKTKKRNQAIDLYVSIRDQHGDRKTKIAEIEMELNSTARQKEAQQIRAQRLYGNNNQAKQNPRGY